MKTRARKRHPPVSTSPLTVYASTDPRVRSVPLPEPGGTQLPNMSRSAWLYMMGEVRWQRFLHGRRDRSGRDQLDLAKAKRARLGSSPGGKTATKRCVTCRGTGRLQSGSTCPICKGRGRVLASAGIVGGGVVNQEVPGGGGAGASEGGGMSGAFA